VFFENAENMQIFLDEGIVCKEQTCLLNGAGVNLEHYQVAEYPDGKTTKFLFVGRVMREKGIDELFATMQRLRKNGVDCTLDVLGGFDEDYSEKIKKYESEGWLTYHGYQLDVRPFIAAAHCFVLPSWHEGMANTNLECAASGRPVITSNIHGCLEAVEDGVSGYLCEKKNADSLYQVMKKFTALPYEKRKSMGLAGRKRMEEIFDKRKVVEETMKRL
jgi:galacturonosyltransferase